MPIVVDKVFDHLRADRGLSEDAYIEAIDNISDISAIPIFSQEGKHYVARALAANACVEVYNLTAINPALEWRYAKIEHDLSPLVEIVFCPPNGIQNEISPPTLAENILLDAWLGGLPAAAQAFSSSVLAKSHVSSIDRIAISTLFGALNCSDVVALHKPHPSFVDEKLIARVNSNSRFINKQISYSRLLDKALKESNARWRFLQFYRLLEQGYLEVILGTISAEFLHDPKQALKQAEKATSSELEQLKNLISSEGLDIYFEFIYDDLEEAARSGNKFATRVNAKANTTGGIAKRDRGAAAVYAIRCAIAHAGVRDIYYEQFQDADVAVGRILSAFEEAVFHFLGVTLAA